MKSFFNTEYVTADISRAKAMYENGDKRGSIILVTKLAEDLLGWSTKAVADVIEEEKAPEKG